MERIDLKHLQFILLFAFTVNFSFSQNQALSNDSLTKKVNQLEKDFAGIKNLKISGWLQAQYQWTESKGAKGFDGGDFLANSNNRFMIRRGRIKFVYAPKNTQFVLQLNATERGVNIVDFYLKLTDPWKNSSSLTLGIMNRPFGFEIQQSSQDRETPERSRFTQILLPNERDLGVMYTFQPVKSSKLYGLKLDAGFYNGTGIAVPGTTSLNGAGVVDFDSYKDFIGRIHYQHENKKEKIKFGFGFSHYNGGYLSQNNVVYKNIVTDSLGIKRWNAEDTLNGQRFKGTKAGRIYFGGDFQLSIKSKIGTTSIRAEYITGQQPGVSDESKSASTLPAKQDTYLRKFNGGYVYLIQRIGKTKHELAFKHEWYDPNTEVSGKDLNGTNNLTKADIKYTILGIGYNYYYTDNVKFMFYYNMIENEKNDGLSGFKSDLKDNVLTMRIQYRF